VFVLALAWIIHERQTDEFQDHFLLGGGLLGATLGLPAGYDVQGIILPMMQGIVLIAVILSIVLHKYLGASPCPTVENAEEMDTVAPHMARIHQQKQYE
jgi:hypothetical protein